MYSEEVDARVGSGKAGSKQTFLDGLVKTVLTSGRLQMSSCHRLASADCAAKTGKRRAGFLTRVRPGLEKHA